MRVRCLFLLKVAPCEIILEDIKIHQNSEIIKNINRVWKELADFTYRAI